MHDGLVAIKTTYTAMIRGKPVMIEAVPVLQDPDTGETFLAPEIASKLFELLSLPENRFGVVQADVYTWQPANT